MFTYLIVANYPINLIFTAIDDLPKLSFTCGLDPEEFICKYLTPTRVVRILQPLWVHLRQLFIGGSPVK